MSPEETLLHQFYQGFQKRDHEAMADCYLPYATFCDPVFPKLKGHEIANMWKMLCTTGKDLEIRFSKIRASEKVGRVHWEADYTFSGTGRKVNNVVEAAFLFQDGKILQHRDFFRFWKWSWMALGAPGLFLGWTPLLLNKVQKQAASKLEKFSHS